MTPKLLSEICLPDSGVLVLRNHSSIHTNSSTAKIAHHQNIPYTLPALRSNDPITGPMIKPSPNIAHISQKFLVFSSLLLEMSVRIACKIDIFHPVIPLMTLESKKIRYAGVMSNIT